jgi:hypothetical protein
MPERAVYLLDADPDLADALDRETAAQARPYVVARVEQVDAGPWDPMRGIEATDSELGLLVLDGIATRDVEVSGRCATEILGSGDLLRPWDQDQGLHAVQPDVRWTVVAPLRYARLDRRFTHVAARWPALMAAIVERATRRSRALAFHLAVTQITGVEQRLHLVLWELAQRWGKVGPEGVSLRLNVTHEMLGRLIGARRPSVTTALRALADEGLVTQEAPGRWVLHGEPA